MNTLTLELERELQTMAPEAAAHFERAVREMLLMLRTREPEKSPPPGPRYEIQARDLGLRPGLSYDNSGELLAHVEGEDWK
jgi:hypothetical protein